MSAAAVVACQQLTPGAHHVRNSLRQLSFTILGPTMRMGHRLQAPSLEDTPQSSQPSQMHCLEALPQGWHRVWVQQCSSSYAHACAV